MVKRAPAVQIWLGVMPTVLVGGSIVDGEPDKGRWRHGEIRRNLLETLVERRKSVKSLIFVVFMI